jgi:hypothetical protein
MIRKLTYNSTQRIETGALQFYQDWPGVYIRGDDCMQLQMILQKIENGEPLNIFDHAYLRSIRKDMLEAVGVAE